MLQEPCMTDEKKNKFKGEGHKWLTQGLFLETTQQSEDRCLYTIMPWDKRKNGKYYPSIHKLFVEMADVSEWKFADTYFDGYQHWLQVKATGFFKPVYAAMVEELHAKIQHMAVEKMVEQVEAGEASQATLSYLANKGYIDKAAVGKPKRRKAPRKEGNVVSADFERITGK